jgi:argininosuccinate synthase
MPTPYAPACTGKGNDQVRFELKSKRFAPDMHIIAPVSERDIRSREEEIDKRGAQRPLKITRETNYSKDKNLWHLSHEGLDWRSRKRAAVGKPVSELASPRRPLRTNRYI